MFKIHQHSNPVVDDKGRVPLPPRLRAALSDRDITSLIAYSVDEAIHVCTIDSFESMEEAATQDPFSDLGRDFIHGVIAYAEDVEVDPVGRIRLPPELRGLVGIELKKKVHIFVAPNWIEIWNEERWEQRYAEARARAKARLAAGGAS